MSARPNRRINKARHVSVNDESATVTISPINPSESAGNAMLKIDNMTKTTRNIMARIKKIFAKRLDLKSEYTEKYLVRTITVLYQ
jgi:hypothetical protein